MSHTFEYKKIKTRADHQCDWCDENIPKGDNAWFHKCVDDEGFYSGYMHPECDAAMQLCKELLGEWSPGDFPRGSSEAY